MKMVRLDEECEVREFAQTAAKYFAKHKDCQTYSELEAGCLFAMRWGMFNDCVIIFRLDEDFEPINYQQLIEKCVKDDGCARDVYY